MLRVLCAICEFLAAMYLHRRREDVRKHFEDNFSVQASFIRSTLEKLEIYWPVLFIVCSFFTFGWLLGFGGISGVIIMAVVTFSTAYVYQAVKDIRAYFVRKIN